MTLLDAARAPSNEELEQIRALNRLFLGFLAPRARAGEDCLGLPEAARPRLAAATDEQLDDVAQFPRALFALTIDRDPPAGGFMAPPADGARYAVDITVLLCAWSFSRHNVCQARFLLGLDTRSIQRLRALQLAELAQYARLPRLLSCAFADNGWIWTELLATRHAEDRRRLALIALQPHAPAAPVRRRGRPY